MEHKPVIGLVGGLGSGKSQIAAEFGRFGAVVVSGDRLGHEALGRPELRDLVIGRFGNGILDEHGNIDRRELGARVFSDPLERRDLEKIVFPWIERRIGEEIEKARNDPRVLFVVLDAAVMFEAGWNKVCDRIVYIDAPREIRLQRLAGQRSWTEDDLRSREQAQLPLIEKRSRCDEVIYNGGTTQELARQVEMLLKKWQVVR